MVPPVQVEDVDEVGLKLLERVADANVQRTAVVSAVVGSFALAESVALVVGLVTMRSVVSREIGRQVNIR